MVPSRRQLSAALDLVGEINDAQTVAELCDLLLAALHRLVPSDYVSYNEVPADGRPPFTVISPAVPDAIWSAWGRLAQTNPLVERFVRTHDGRAHRFSDVVSPAELRATALYREVYAPLGVEHQIAFTIPAAEPTLVVGVALSRGGARDYDDVERALLDAVRPHLSQALRNVRGSERSQAALAAVRAGVDLRGAAVVLVDRGGTVVAATGAARDVVGEMTSEELEAGRPVPARLRGLLAGPEGALVVELPSGAVIVRRAEATDGATAWVLDRTGVPLHPETVRHAQLTSRESAVLTALACGRSVAETATELGVSPRTVDKHAERASRKLGARDRAHAIALVWAAAVPYAR